jgi:hypothetical protein
LDKPNEELKFAREKHIHQRLGANLERRR